VPLCHRFEHRLRFADRRQIARLFSAQKAKIGRWLPDDVGFTQCVRLQSKSIGDGELKIAADSRAFITSYTILNNKARSVCNRTAWYILTGKGFRDFLLKRRFIVAKIYKVMSMKVLESFDTDFEDTFS